MHDIVIPKHLKDYLEVEDCSNFNMKNYFVSQQMKEIKNDIIRTREKSTIIQEILGTFYPNTTLLYGPPGTGKTSFAKYLAHEFDTDFVYINFSKIFNGIFGKTTGIISDIFDFMTDKECIFVLDEIDCISQKRGTEADVTGGEISRVTVTLMQSMDKLRQNKSKVILIGCTNRIDIMDAALKSRFSISKELRGLNNQEKQTYIEMFLDDINKKLLKAGMNSLNYKTANIMEYCSRGVTITQRNVEMDLIRCIAEWLDDTTQPFELNHIKE